LVYMVTMMVYIFQENSSKPRNSPEKNIYHHCYHINQEILLKRIYTIIITI
jgi:hypothetical protein